MGKKSQAANAAKRRARPFTGKEHNGNIQHLFNNLNSDDNLSDQEEDKYDN